VLDPITGNFKAGQFCRIVDRFSRRAKPTRIIDDPDNQRPDKWSSAVLKLHFIIGHFPPTVNECCLSRKHGFYYRVPSSRNDVRRYIRTSAPTIYSLLDQTLMII
jgi:hypothetical protein